MNLLPCPLCGSADGPEYHPARDNSYGNVTCTECGIELSDCIGDLSAEAAVRRWNEPRKAPIKTDEEVAVILAAIINDISEVEFAIARPNNLGPAALEAVGRIGRMARKMLKPYVKRLEIKNLELLERKNVEKPILNALLRDTPETAEGKYLVKRRDGTVAEWPHFVLGARDPHAEVALRAYAESIASDPECTPGLVESIGRLADDFHRYRQIHGTGDPTRGRHRIDDPATIAEMRSVMPNGGSA